MGISPRFTHRIGEERAFRRRSQNQWRVREGGVVALSRGLKALVWFSIIGMFAVLMAGALVSKTGSGDGCGASWPLCHGELFPDGSIASFIEYNHRVISGVVGLVVLAFSVVLWRNYGQRPEMRFLAGASIFFLILQSGLGAWVVLAPQPDWLLAIHFGVSSAAFAAVLLGGIMVYQLHRGDTGRATPVSPRLRRWAWITLIVIYIVIYSGAYVRHTNTNLACLDWPLCNGQLIPADLFGPEGVQFAHRLAALSGALVIAWLVRLAYQERKTRPDVFRAAMLSLGLIILQSIFGGMSVLNRLELFTVMMHSAVITVLFGVLSYICLQVTPEPELSEDVAADALEAAEART